MTPTREQAEQLAKWTRCEDFDLQPCEDDYICVACSRAADRIDSALSAAYRAGQVAELEEAAGNLDKLSVWVRGNVKPDDAVDDCARLLANNASGLRERAARLTGQRDA